MNSNNEQHWVSVAKDVMARMAALEEEQQRISDGYKRLALKQEVLIDRYQRLVNMQQAFIKEHIGDIPSEMLRESSELSAEAKCLEERDNEQ